MRRPDVASVIEWTPEKGGYPMRRSILVAFALASRLASAALAQTFVGVLNGANEFPGPGDSDGFGLAGFRIEGTTVAYSIMVQHLTTPTASHIHRGAAGVAGPVVVTLATSFPGDRASGTVTISEALRDEIFGNPSGFYFNIHNAEFPNGAIRGQLQFQPYSLATYFPVVGRA